MAIIIFALSAILFWIWGYGMRFFVRLGIVLGRWLNIHWSNHYWRDAKKDMELQTQDKRGILCATKYAYYMGAKIMSLFKWTKDGFAQLGDSTPPPAEAYKRFCDTRRHNTKNKSLAGFEKQYFAEDCDGFHACLYHALAKSGIECKLLGIAGVMGGGGHCVLMYKDEGDMWHVVDYLNDYALGQTNEEIKETIDYKYGEEYRHDYVLTTRTFDYEQGKYIFGGVL